MRRMVNENEISQLYIVDDIKEISSDILNKLKAGDIVLKNTNGQLHAYSVSFKKNDEGICLTYSDASVVETQSYDLIDGVWTYNSEDKTNLVNYTAGDNISINNGVISATTPHLYEYVFSATCNDNIEWYFRCLTTENVNNLSDLLNAVYETSKAISIIGESSLYAVKPISSIYYNDEARTEMFIDELYDNEQIIGFMVADASYQSKKQLF